MFGIITVAGSVGEVLNCLYQTDFCTGGFSQSVYFNTLPDLIGGSLMVAVALVLIVLAYRLR